jgi:CarD family transcriptional regulator
LATTARRWEAKVGELAVYPGPGGARIEALQIRAIAGQKLEFLVLRKLDDESRILIPRDRIAEVGLRPPIERADAQRIWKILKERKRTKARSGIAWSRQFRELQEKLKLGTIFETAEVLRDLLRLQHTKELSFGERKLLENARSLLVQELAAAEDIGTEEVEASIRAAVVGLAGGPVSSTGARDRRRAAGTATAFTPPPSGEGRERAAREQHARSARPECAAPGRG